MQGEGFVRESWGGEDAGIWDNNSMLAAVTGFHTSVAPVLGKPHQFPGFHTVFTQLFQVPAHPAATRKPSFAVWEGTPVPIQVP